ncbi:MAG: hypothetical protein IKV72_04825, partial [Firmicutes bacterium]|nr:hypothetical protein [Bacillota bacterium]
MKKILPASELHMIKDLVGKHSGLLMDEKRNFFTVLDDKTYLLSFHWLDEKKVVAYAATSFFVLITDSE